MIHFTPVRIQKLNAKGITHFIVPILVMVGIAAIGTYMLKASHADTVSRLVYESSPYQFTIVNSDGTNPQQVDAGYYGGFPVFIHNNSKLAYYSSFSHFSNGQYIGTYISTVSVTNKNKQDIAGPLGNHAQLYSAAWSQPMQRLAGVYSEFDAQGNLQGSRVVSMNADGSNLQTVKEYVKTSGSGAIPFVNNVKWSPNGKWLLIDPAAGITFRKLIKNDGSGEKDAYQSLDTTGNNTGYQLNFTSGNAWSADSAHLLLYKSDVNFSTRKASLQLYSEKISDYSTAQIGSLNIKLPVNPTSFTFVPSWSPDSKLVAYGYIANGKLNVSILDRTTNTSKQIALVDGVTSIDKIAWNSDGSQIAYMYHFTAVGGQPKIAIKTAFADGNSAPTQVYTTDQANMPEYDFNWSE